MHFHSPLHLDGKLNSRTIESLKLAREQIHAGYESLRQLPPHQQLLIIQEYERSDQNIVQSIFKHDPIHLLYKVIRFIDEIANE